MEDLRIALIQTDLIWEDIAGNLKLLEKKIKNISAEVDLIVLPEMFSTGFSMNAVGLAQPMDGSAVQCLREMAMDKQCVVTGSIMLYENNGAERKYYNRLVWMKPDGQYDTYDKHHLFSLSQEPKIYTAGGERIIISLNGWKICPMICYDLRFPVWSRNAIDSERRAAYDILIYVASWPERRSIAWQTLLQARAIENQAYLIGVNRIGKDNEGISHIGSSSVIDPLGAILYRKDYEEDISILSLKYEELIKIRRQFPFLKDADEFDLK